MRIFLEMLFFNLSNIDIEFGEKELVQRNYTATEAPSIIKKIKLINKKDFAK